MLVGPMSGRILVGIDSAASAQRRRSRSQSRGELPDRRLGIAMSSVPDRVSKSRQSETDPDIHAIRWQRPVGGSANRADLR